jgi:multidrug efflux pump subunit AcrA (membrane-fusion protein)
MDGSKDLEASLRKARAELERAQAEYSICLFNDPGGCAAEQEAVAAAERKVRQLERKLHEVVNHERE